jgi:hypothetical protein
MFANTLSISLHPATLHTIYKYRKLDPQGRLHLSFVVGTAHIMYLLYRKNHACYTGFSEDIPVKPAQYTGTLFCRSDTFLYKKSSTAYRMK